MSAKILVALRLVAAGLFVWMVVLYLAGPSRTYHKEVAEHADTFTVECLSLADEAWRKSPAHLDGQHGIRLTYRVTDGEEPDAERGRDRDPLSVSRELNAKCDQARAHRAAAIGMLAAPTAVLAALGMLLRPRDPFDGTPHRPGGTTA